MRDLKTQLRSYAELLDGSAPPVTELYDAADLAEVVIPGRNRAMWRRPVAVAAGVAVAAVAVVGGLLLLARGSVAPEPPAATTSGPSITAAVVSDEITVTPVGAVPALAAKPLGGAFITPGGAVVDGGRIHAFIEVYGDEDAAGTVYHATSPDGTDWQVAPSPLFTSDDVPYGEAGFEVDSAVVAPDGTWIIYFSIVTEKADVVADTPWVSMIGAATAPGPDGPWLIEDAPVLEPGEATGWDGLRVSTPAVVVAGGELVMLYTGVDQNGLGQIGTATSTDGLHWRRRADPVITPDAAWEGSETIRPDLVRTESGWIAAFSGSSRNWRGLAYSTDDGATWTKDPRNPVLSIADLDRPQLRAAELVYAGGDLFLLVENGGPRSGSELTVLRLAGGIPPDGF
jgi:predicted GH43/DUF377 family glycosyl hydrolase